VTETLPPPGVQTMLGAAGAPARVQWRGKPWLVGHPVQKAKAELEEIAAAAAVAEVRALKGALPSDAYAELWKDTVAAIQAKEFRTWGPGWARTVFARENAHLFLLSLLRCDQPHATEDDARGMAAEEPEQVTAALARVVPDFFAHLLAGLTVPPDQRETFTARVGEITARFKAPPDSPTPPTP
jgi:hypothetical protein